MTALSFGVPFSVGNNISFAGVTAIVVNSTGGVSFSTGVDLKSNNIFDMAEFTADPSLALIKPADALIANYVKLYTDFEMRVGEIVAAGFVSQLEAFAAAFNYGRVQMQTRNPWSTASVSNFTCYGIVSHLERQWHEEKQVAVLVLKPAGVAPEWTTGTPSI